MVQQSLLNFIDASYEILKSDPEHGSELSQIPEVQFLRWCRNAAFHHNQFKIHPDSLDKEASWDGHEITADLDGRELLGDYLQEGDLIALMTDVKDIVLAQSDSYVFEK